VIYAAPGASFTAIATGYPTGLTGTLGVRIRDATETDVVARHTTGIVEGVDPDFPTVVTYTATLTAPATSGAYEVVWDDSFGNIASEDLAVTSTAPATGTEYATVSGLKDALSLTGQTYADNDITNAINAASRGIDSATGRRFYLEAESTRYYTPDGWRLLEIDDLVTLTSLSVDRGGAGVYAETWADGTDFVLEPFNNPAINYPYTQIRARRISGRYFPVYGQSYGGEWAVEKSVKVTGVFGWPAVPADVMVATEILASKLLKRVREAPFGIVTVGLDAGAAMRIARTDPDVANLISHYTLHRPFV